MSTWSCKWSHKVLRGWPKIFKPCHSKSSSLNSESFAGCKHSSIVHPFHLSLKCVKRCSWSMIFTLSKWRYCTLLFLPQFFRFWLCSMETCRFQRESQFKDPQMDLWNPSLPRIATRPQLRLRSEAFKTCKRPMKTTTLLCDWYAKMKRKLLRDGSILLTFLFLRGKSKAEPRFSARINEKPRSGETKALLTPYNSLQRYSLPLCYVRQC